MGCAWYQSIIVLRCCCKYSNERYSCTGSRKNSVIHKTIAAATTNFRMLFEYRTLIRDGCQGSCPKHRRVKHKKKLLPLPRAVRAKSRIICLVGQNLIQRVSERNSCDPWFRQEVITKEPRRIRGEIHTRDVIIVFQIAYPSSKQKSPILAFVRGTCVHLRPSINFIAFGVEFPAVRFALPVEIPTQWNLTR